MWRYQRIWDDQPLMMKSIRRTIDRIDQFIWANCNDLTSWAKLVIMVSKGNHPQMAASFRLANDNSLPRFMYSISINLFFFPICVLQNQLCGWLPNIYDHAKPGKLFSLKPAVGHKQKAVTDPNLLLNSKIGLKNQFGQCLPITITVITTINEWWLIVKTFFLRLSFTYCGLAWIITIYKWMIEVLYPHGLMVTPFGKWTPHTRWFSNRLAIVSDSYFTL